MEACRECVVSATLASVQVLAAQTGLQCLSDMSLPTSVNSFLMGVSLQHAATDVSNLVLAHRSAVRTYHELHAECVELLRSPGTLHRATSSSPNMTSYFVFCDKVVLWHWTPEPKKDGGFVFVLLHI